jgi:chitinase
MSRNVVKTRGVGRAGNTRRSIRPAVNQSDEYDFSVAFGDKTNFNAPPFAAKGALNVNAAVNGHLGAGVPPAKIVMGVRFVGTGWQDVGPTNNGLHQTATGPAPGT